MNNRIERIERKSPIIKDWPIKLNLGCGKSIRKGYIGLDIKDFGQELVWDMEENLPFPDKSVEAIFTSHVFEHLDNFMGVMNECWRVLTKIGQLHIVVPHLKHIRAYVPVHKIFFTKYTFRFFERDDVEIYNINPWKIKEIVTNERMDIHCWMNPIK